MRCLVILESHTKIKTVGKILGPRYRIVATAGHIRRLPRRQLAIDTNDGYEPLFVLDENKASLIEELKREARQYQKIILATDPDREGEGIAWHICEVLGLDPSQTERVDVGEITSEAVNYAFANPRLLDSLRVSSYLARRVLDRLIGYTLSPWLYGMMQIQKPATGSAGRVQSPALRLLCDREREIAAFKSVAYWMINGTFAPGNHTSQFTAGLNGVKPSGAVVSKPGKGLPSFYISNEETADHIVLDLPRRSYEVGDVQSHMQRINPPMPFNTSDLLVTASRELGFTPDKTMSVAQELFEGIDENTITEDHCLLYELIWNRFMGSQMTPAVSEITTITVLSDIKKTEGRPISGYIFTTEAGRVEFAGHLILNGVETQAQDGLPTVKTGDPVSLENVDLNRFSTQPPPRYSEGTLVDALKKYGIGRPSTYSGFTKTLIGHCQVVHESPGADDGALRPTSFGMQIIDFLSRDHSQVVDFEYTSALEDDLDRIMAGEIQWRSFVDKQYQEWIHKPSPHRCPLCDAPMHIRISDRGQFWGCTQYPDCTGSRPLDQGHSAATGNSRTSVPRSPQKEATGNCKHCGRTIQGDWVFCIFCGKSLE